MLYINWQSYIISRDGATRGDLDLIPNVDTPRFSVRATRLTHTKMVSNVKLQTISLIQYRFTFKSNLRLGSIPKVA